MSGTAPHALDPAPDLAVRIALRDRALRTLSELMAAEHSVSDRRQAATAALRYLALFEKPRAGIPPANPTPPAPPPDTSPPPRPASSATPASLRFEPLPTPPKPAAPRASGRSGRDPDFIEREEHYPYRKRARTAPAQHNGESALANLALRSGAQPIAIPSQSPATSRGGSDSHTHDHARAPPA